MVGEPTAGIGGCVPLQTSYTGQLVHCSRAEVSLVVHYSMVEVSQFMLCSSLNYLNIGNHEDFNKSLMLPAELSKIYVRVRLFGEPTQSVFLLRGSLVC